MTTDNDRDDIIEDGDNIIEDGGELSAKQRTNREISNENLIPYKPGESGNPTGRPAGKSITAELRKLLDSGTVAEDLAKVLLSLAKTSMFNKQQLPALKELLDRTDGKVVETHKLESDIPINITMKLVKGEDATKQGEE